MTGKDNIVKYGYTPVPRDPDVLLMDHPTASGNNPKQDPFKFSDIPFPDSLLVQNVKEFVKVIPSPVFLIRTNTNGEYRRGN